MTKTILVVGALFTALFLISFCKLVESSFAQSYGNYNNQRYYNPQMYNDTSNPDYYNSNQIINNGQVYNPNDYNFNTDYGRKPSRCDRVNCNNNSALHSLGN